MKPQRRFRSEFKHQLVEKLLSGISSPAQIIRHYEISCDLPCHCQDQYAKGAFENPPDRTAVLEERVRQLERLVDKLTLENEFLQKRFSAALNLWRRAAVPCPETFDLA
jgi:hypothetical protein